MKGTRQHGNQRGLLGAREESRVAVQRRSGVMLLLPSSRHRVAVGDSEAVVHQPQDRVTIEHQRPHDKLLLCVDIVIVITQESVGE